MHTAIPKNLASLWEKEDDLIGWAAQIVASEEYLQEHLWLIEAYMGTVDLLRQAKGQGNRFVAVCGLFMRTFDSTGNAVRATFSGRYSSCAMHARDLLETLFLLDYLLEEEGRPEDWLACPIDELRKKFGPVEIRKALDQRDGFMAQKRKTHYSMLSNLGAHPTPVSFNLKRDGMQLIRLGPFKHRDMFEECMQEIAKIVLMLGELLKEYCNEEVVNGSAITSRLSLQMQRAHEKYFAKK